VTISVHRVTILHDEPGLILAETEHGIVACRSMDEVVAWSTGFQEFLMTPEQSAELLDLMRCYDRVSRNGASAQERESLEERRAAFHRSVAGPDGR
jgi:hypothetical protein